MRFFAVIIILFSTGCGRIVKPLTDQLTYPLVAVSDPSLIYLYGAVANHRYMEKKLPEDSARFISQYRLDTLDRAMYSRVQKLQFKSNQDTVIVDLIQADGIKEMFPNQNQEVMRFRLFSFTDSTAKVLFEYEETSLIAELKAENQPAE